MHLIKALHKLKADWSHQFEISDNHSLALLADQAFWILALHILADELEQIAVLAVLKY